MLAVLGLLLVFASTVPLAAWRWDVVGGEGVLVSVALALAGFGCLGIYNRGTPGD